jgi:hypothetical protein
MYPLNAVKLVFTIITVEFISYVSESVGDNLLLFSPTKCAFTERWLPSTYQLITISLGVGALLRKKLVISSGGDGIRNAQVSSLHANLIHESSINSR